MSRTTVHYILMPKLKSFLTSCRRAKTRCQPNLAESKPRRQAQDLSAHRRPAPSAQKDGSTPLAAPGQTTPGSK